MSTALRRDGDMPNIVRIIYSFRILNIVNMTFQLIHFQLYIPVRALMFSSVRLGFKSHYGQFIK